MSMMARRMMRKHHVRCRAGEKVKITSKPYGDSNKVMTVSNKDNPFKVGDTVRIGGTRG